YDAVTLTSGGGPTRPIAHLFRVTASYPSTASGDPVTNGATHAAAWTVVFAGALWTDRRVTVTVSCMQAAFTTLVRTAIGNRVAPGEIPAAVANRPLHQFPPPRCFAPLS